MDLGECEIIDELDFREQEQIPHIMVKLMEGQVLEEFMLEEETDFQDIDTCKMVETGIDRKTVELSDEQEIERCTSPEMSMRIACEQEECIEEEICDMSVPKSYKVEESVYKNGIMLETPKINAVEISALPREIKLEKPIEQRRSKLQTKQKKVLGFKVVRRVNPTKLVKREICRPPPKPLDNLNDKLKASKRRVNPIRLAKRNIRCRPPPTPLFAKC